MRTPFNTLPTQRDRVAFQLDEWAKGNSLHNDVDGYCCPDYSCCVPTLKAFTRARAIYVQSFILTDEYILDQLQSMFSGAYMNYTGQQIVCHDAPYDLAEYH